MASSAAVSQIQVFSTGGFLIDIGFEQPVPILIPARHTANVQRYTNPGAFCLFRAIFFENNISLHICVAASFGDEEYCLSLLSEANLNFILTVDTLSSKGKIGWSFSAERASIQSSVLWAEILFSL
jgi:hypothetical protein